MIGARLAVRAACAAGLAALLTGCISVFPKEKPAQLYRFGDTLPASTAQAPAVAPATGFNVEALPLSFDRAAAGDAILTMTGNEAAYIKGSRWVGSAQTLFETALARAFESSGRGARLLARGEPSRPDYLLKLNVLRFEARYDQGRAAPPRVVVEMEATLSRGSDHGLAGERLFQATAPAEANRAGAIATGFDHATGKVLTDLVTWVNAKGGA